jgi:transcriptional regulator with XRE-family HTH domain
MRRLRQWLEATGTKKRELAERVNLTPGAVSQIASGLVNPSVDTLKALARETGLSVDELLFGDVANASPPVSDRHATP